MTHANKVLAFSIFGLAVVLFLLFLDRGLFNKLLPHPSRDAICKHVQSKPAVPFKLSDVTPVVWDKFYLFNPYTSETEIESILGFQWDGAAQSGIAQNECHLFVFIRTNTVVDWFCYPSSCGYFQLRYDDDSRHPAALVPDSAWFTVKERKGPYGTLLDVQLTDNVEESG